MGDALYWRPCGGYRSPQEVMILMEDDLFSPSLGGLGHLDGSSSDDDTGRHDPAASSDPTSRSAMSSAPSTGSTPVRSAAPAPAPRQTQAGSTAVVYCEANFGDIDGKTANGLVRYSETYRVLSVIDSEKAGLDTGEVLDGIPNGIPVCTDLTEAIAEAGHVPEFFIFGMAPASGMLSASERRVVLDAIERGMNVVNGLHEFLNDDPEFAAAAAARNVTILDVRRPRAKKDLRMFSGRISTVTCPRIAVLGTDGAIGKRTTATILARALNERGIKTVLIGTGQTGLIQGARYGVALDAIPCQFCSGEMEAAVVEAFEEEHPDAIVIEGQGALSHPAYLTSNFILRGARPDAVILQHAPGRHVLSDFPDMPMPTPASEINLIQTYADTRVIGLTLNHEQMTEAEISAAITLYERELGIPVTDALTRPPGRLVDMVLRAFPKLKRKLHARTA
jgi:uncharacterized NAD-dependent epimerase/dehydratase family protein